MPIYEYKCAKCKQRTSAFVRSFAPPESVQCSHCGSNETQKMVSTFMTRKSKDSQDDVLSDPSSWGDVNEKDPKSVARWMRRMEQAVGQDLGSDLDELAEQVVAGEEPQDLDAAEDEGTEAEEGGDSGEDSDFD